MSTLEIILFFLGLAFLLISWIERKNLKVLKKIDLERSIKRVRVVSLEKLELINNNITIIGIMLIISSILMFLFEFLNLSP